MADTIAHRGPDGEGFYSGGQVHLGNRRLAIQDVPGGSQPMANEDGSVVVVYNGEIYNYPELRELVLARGHRLTTHCDTEVLPHLYEDEGIAFAARLNGIFAFALYDRGRRALFLVRDPLGVKPLVYSIRDGKLAFGSEAKAVLASGLVSPEIDEASLHLTMNVRYIPGDRTFFAGIRRLPPGHALEFAEGRSRLRQYAGIDWTPDPAPGRDEWLEGIRHHYAGAVKRQLISDVPVGVSLSGGIDSSSIVAMLRQATSGPIQTFSLGFDEPTDETGDARFVAETYGTEHQEVVLHEPALAHLADAIRHTEEPKVNSLQLYLLHRFIGQHVHVVLSGLGGDELFAGYDFYRYMLRAGRLRNGASGATVRALAPALDWAARQSAGLAGPRWTWPRASSSGWPPPATGPATTCCSATPGTSTRRCCGGCTPPSSPAGWPPPSGTSTGPTSRTPGRWRARPCGPSSRPRWCATCCTTRTPCRWRTRWSPGCRCWTSSWSGSPPASRMTCASAPARRGCSRRR